ncbi:efflux RND transporter periplasmic adaptor subunit [Foetidibacter luteolus]|uniref:efflux RND transporter periplasmic adaptor subunit n=1 Tax=Foetidibacter luteolus TaxID=2608880 RepID=UPI001A98D721|nr:efflux RND transporter periplasmic adaptor subunit [Foetidibacter luteolus]
MMKYYLYLTAIFLIAITGCTVKGGTENTGEKPITLPVVRLEEKDTVLQQGYVTDIQALQNVEIRAKVPGFIDKILVDEGQAVTKGQPLFIINDAEYQTQLSQSKAALASAVAEAKTAELEMKRVKILVEKNIISKTELELAEAKIKSAEAKISEARSLEENAKIRLSYTYIRSPFNGVIDRIPFKVGSLVTEGNLLTTVSNLEAMYAYFNVSENEYLRYMKTKKSNKPSMDDVVLVLADGTEYAYKGDIETMESEFDENTGSIAFRAKFPNPEKILKHGASGKVKLTTEVSSALMIPQKAVFEIQDKNYVFVVGKDNKVTMKNFAPQTRIDEFIIVKSGLSAGDTIVYEGIQSIRDGASITPRYVQSDSLVAAKL